MRHSKPRTITSRKAEAKPAPTLPKKHKKRISPTDDLNDPLTQCRGNPPERRLPRGMTPRLLSRDAAAAYCGVTAETFETHVRPHVQPVEIGARRLWDVRALDSWLDVRPGLADALRPVEDWLTELGDGDTHARD